ncbi:hypothetical protein M422DRAFT_47686 [Sphaerobolus stellatus SS14]|uniref:Uncharacterized protein n=1 Tax=Sphaerobolus stellatus (strain SS14) TaxID=990650 RepID=A0A0C9VP68_SPHS4|nr:hypothetical protein M422DRAFT_47686 [Sphaerobolus stellatus SS14]
MVIVSAHRKSALHIPTCMSFYEEMFILTFITQSFYILRAWFELISLRWQCDSLGYAINFSAGSGTPFVNSLLVVFLGLIKTSFSLGVICGHRRHSGGDFHKLHYCKEMFRRQLFGNARPLGSNKCLLGLLDSM